MMTFAPNMEGPIHQLKQLLSFPREISIITHRNPDGDAIGSSMGLSSYLKKLNHNVKVVFPSEYPQSYGYIKDIQ